MLLSKFRSALVQAAKPLNLARLGLVVFLATTLYLKLPPTYQEAAHPTPVKAVSCSDGKCESAGHCWDQGFTGYNGDNGCKYVCQGGNWSNQDCNTSQQEKDTAKALQNQYNAQVAAANAANGGGGSSTAAAPAAPPNTCGAGSATGCTGKPFYSSPAAGLQCFPNGVNVSTGAAVCGRDYSSNVGQYKNPVTGAMEGGYLITAEGNGAVGPDGKTPITTNPNGGGCPAVVHCGCTSGQVSLCVKDADLLGKSVAQYCANNVCTPVGTNGKVCTPGQVSECIPGTTQGKYCNLDGKGWTTVHAHACGATHTVAYCAQSSTAGGGTVCNAGATTYNTLSACQAANGSQSQFCKQGVSTIKTPECTAGSNARGVFVGCGTGAQAKWNCYQGCANGKTSRVCHNEPGLSCGALETNKVAQVTAAVEQRFTSTVVTTPTSPPPSTPPAPTPTPAVTCGQPCGGTNQAYCSGANMACLQGTCKSTLCAPASQNSQCICASPPPNPPICVDIFASKTNIKLNDQVSFTCAAVNNAVAYQFRYGYLTKSEGTAGLVMQDLQPATSTSRTSQPITVDKVGRYIAQCRPCAANNLCSEWEPVGGENGAPELEPGTTAQ